MEKVKASWPLWLSLLIIFLIFSPIVGADFFPIDDAGMVHDIQSRTQWNLKSLFFRDTSTGLYYRPLTYTTYLWDHFWFNADPAVMHFENLFYHLLNSLWIYLICGLLLEKESKHRAFYCAVAALLFGVHPLVTESVSWVSGRTDLLAGFFLLGATFCLLKYKLTRRWPWIMAALATSFMALLCKEAAIAFSPAFLLILAADSDNPAAVKHKRRYYVLLCLVVAALTVTAFVLMRGLDYSNNNSRIGLTLQYISNSPWHSLWLVMRGIGFYLKKMLLPWPLNFAIVDVDPVYELLAIPFVLLCLWLLVRNRLRSAVFLTGLVLLTPPLAMVFGQVAWTPFAERYLYLPLGLMVPATLAGLAGLRMGEALFKYTQVVLLLMILFFAMTSLRRAWQWSEPMRILADTAKKSPYAIRINYVYGTALGALGRYDEAIVQLKKTSHYASYGFDEKADVFLVELYREMKKSSEAVDVALKLLEKKNGRSLQAVDQLLAISREFPVEKSNLLIQVDALLKKHATPELYLLAAMLYENNNNATSQNYYVIAAQAAIAEMQGDDVLKRLAQRRH